MAQTTTRVGGIEQAGRQAGQVGRQAGQAVKSAVRSPWVEYLARFGYAARGVVYAFVGFLAFQAAFGMGGQTTGTRGALSEIAEKSRILLGFVAVGLIGYALWRFVQAVLDPEGKGDEAKGLAKRTMMLASGIVYSSLAVAAVRLLTGNGGGGTGDGAQQATAGILGKPFGVALVAIAGLAIIAAGLNELKNGWTQKFRNKLKLNEMSPAEQTWMTRTGIAGLIARGVVFLLTGTFLVQAAMSSDPSRARGLQGALETVASQPYGTWLLALMGIGLLAFGAYSLFLARYRRIYF
ncbi:MAG TPA: DUF1206 domain-containing protein [Thermoanaerobaculia bacterium]|nr:DUF1206 domain-containing protein [Thermoanaerobaculia bacterium]